MRRSLWLLGLSWWAATVAAAPVQYPLVRAVGFAGNDVTRPIVMQREMVIHVGDPADPGKIERSRQAILDLGLFDSVSVRQTSVPDGVKLTFVVSEKWYVLPLPRVNMNSANQFSYGGQLRWNNVAGLNQTLRLVVQRGAASLPGHSGETSYDASYNMPFIPFFGRSRYGLNLRARHNSSTVVDTAQSYREINDDVGITLSRSLSNGPLSQGWQVDGGMLWQHERTAGVAAPAANGAATALVGLVSYNDVHSDVYSERGSSFNVRYALAKRGVLSDYGYSKITASYERRYDVGSTPYQNLNLIADTGLRNGGPPADNAFTLGGSHVLRAYPSGAFEGNLYYRFAAEFLRPVYYNWLRVLVVAEAGNAFPEPGTVNFRRIHASIGLGVRIVVPFLVNVELEAGVAFPTDDLSHPRFFGGQV